MPDMPPIPAMLLTARQTAAALALSERTVFRIIRSGALPALHINGCLRIDTADVRTYVDRLKGAPPVKVAQVASDVGSGEGQS